MTTPKKFVDEARKICPFVGPHGNDCITCRDIALALATSHDEGVREEREACAKVALSFKITDKALLYKYEELNDLCEHIAQAIRQRSSK